MGVKKKYTQLEREWTNVLSQKFIDKFLINLQSEKIDLISRKDNTLHKVLHVALDSELNRICSKKNKPRSFDWIGSRWFPLIDHLLWVSKLCAISYPYRIEDEQLTEFLKLAHHNGFSVEIDEFGTRTPAGLRFIIYKND